jgi:hypothetical protein
VTIRPLRFILVCFSLILVVVSCKKLNEATELGDDVIPGVDGVNTFDTTLTVETYDSIFAPERDSVRVTESDDHILGYINDPIFGKTTAKFFMQVRPDNFKFGFSNVYNKDSLYLDSVVMVLGWTGTFGDTLAPQRVRVWEMDQSNDFKIDTFSRLYMLRQQYFTYSNLLGTKDFLPYQLKDSVKVFQDSASGQLRIKLNNSFGRRLLDYDTTNAYASDSAFKTYLKGFAFDTDPSFGNALMAFDIDGDTKLAVYYRYTKGGQDDTAVSYFRFQPYSSGHTTASAQHNYIERNGFAGTPLAAAASDPAQDNIVYLAVTPGSYATVKIPGLKTLSSNRIINRAELIVEQLYDPSDKTFWSPPGMMLDAFDSANGFYKVIPYDFGLDQQGQPLSSFGLYGKNTVNSSGNPIIVWKFNMTRYVQNILTKNEVLYNFRLHTPYYISDRMRASYSNNTGSYIPYSTFLNTHFAFGRVRVGGGNHPTQRMRLRIIYTKI